MRLAVSNIAWPVECDPAAYALLRDNGVRGLEVAPTRFWPGWEGASPTAARRKRRELEEEGLSVPALQSVTYDLPELMLFGSLESRNALVDHLERVADLAAELGARVLVFGAPRTRARGELDPVRADEIAVETFAEIGRRCATRGVVLGLEPNPPEYGCDFVTRSPEGLALVEAVASPGFGLHLDAAGLHLAGESPSEALPPTASVLRHFHASEPYLETFADPVVDHRAMAVALAAISYDGWISIEMRSGKSPLQSLAEAVGRVSRLYGGQVQDGDE